VTDLLQAQTAGIPLPVPTPVSEPFWAGCAAGELRYQRCADCDHAEHDPAWACRRCGSRRLDWRVSAGRGVVETHTVVRRPQTPGFAVPYAVVIVGFDEGFRMLTNLVGCTASEVRTGLPVRVTFRPVDSGDGGDDGERTWLPYVEPRDDENGEGNA